MHVELPILGGTQIMATDILQVRTRTHRRNNITISLESRYQREQTGFYAGLSEDLSIRKFHPADMNFGDIRYLPKIDFGVRWMFNVMNQQG